MEVGENFVGDNLDLKFANFHLEVGLYIPL